jgi:hypothetical protein
MASPVAAVMGGVASTHLSDAKSLLVLKELEIASLRESALQQLEAQVCVPVSHAVRSEGGMDWSIRLSPCMDGPMKMHVPAAPAAARRTRDASGPI